MMGGIVLWYVFATLYSARIYSPVYDEPGHLAAGLGIWQQGRFDLYAVNPPLSHWVSGALASLSSAKLSEAGFRGQVYARPEFELGAELVAGGETSFRSCLLYGRLGTILFGVAAIAFIYKIAHRLGGETAAVVSSGLYAFDPLVLGHGCLATPDVPAAATGAGAAWALMRFLGHPNRDNTLLLGAMFGLALGTKFTHLFVLATLLLVFLVIHIGVGQGRVPFSALMGAGVVALFTVNLLYGFQDSFEPLGDIPLRSEILRTRVLVGDEALANRLSGTPLGRVPSPLPKAFIQGIDVQRIDFERSNNPYSYLMGRWKEGGWYHYYAIALVVKTPLLYLVAAVTIIPVGVWCVFRDSYRNVRSIETIGLLIVCIAVFLLISSQTGFNRHLRYLLPIVPFFYAVLGKFIVDRVVSRPATLWLALFVVVHILATSLCAGHWLSHFNLIAGGTTQGHRWLLGSNLDWGQDFYRLRTAQQVRPSWSPLRVVARASYDPSSLGIETLPGPASRPSSDRQAQELLPGIHAVSINRLMAGIPQRSDPEIVSYLSIEPIARVGDGWVIYEIPPKNTGQ